MQNFWAKYKKEIILLFFFIVVFIAVRSIHYPERLDFSTDQATSSSRILDMVRNRVPVLIGARFTLEYHGRYMFLGPYYYYIQSIFLLLGNFEPIVSSYLFVIASSLTLIPLYIGVKKLFNNQAAVLAVIIYTLLPWSINYTTFLWNPNYQYVLLPFLVLLIALFQQQRSIKVFGALAFLTSVIWQLHYIFTPFVFGILVYYFLIRKLGWHYFWVFIGGFVLALAPMILFELRNDFYNTRTFILFINHFGEVFPTAGGVGHGDPHYLIPFVTFSILILIYLIRNKLNNNILIGVFLVLLLWSLVIYLPTPTNAYGMSEDWNYLDEYRANQLLEQELKTDNIQAFNVSNLIYDSKAEVQKYLLKKDGYEIDPEDYKKNQYLFVITDRNIFLNDPAYEIKNINAQTDLKSWDINGRYRLHLAQRNR